VVNVLFGFANGASHDCDRFLTVWTIGGLAREHDRITSVQDCVGHIAAFGTGRSWVGDHGLEHLCRSNDWLASNVAL
jgi:hypothetical protein